MSETEELFAEWLATRPACVQALAKEFPIGSTFALNGETMYLIGYTESDMLMVSPISPEDDYDAAMEQRRHVCAAHLRPAP